jgi:hypothetical protein
MKSKFFRYSDFQIFFCPSAKKGRGLFLHPRLNNYTVLFFCPAALCTIWSPKEFHPYVPKEPYLKVSLYTALPVYSQMYFYNMDIPISLAVISSPVKRSSHVWLFLELKLNKPSPSLHYLSVTSFTTTAVLIGTLCFYVQRACHHEGKTNE